MQLMAGSAVSPAKEILLGHMTVRRQPQGRGLGGSAVFSGLEFPTAGLNEDPVAWRWAGEHLFSLLQEWSSEVWLTPPALEAFPVPREPLLTPSQTPVWRDLGSTSDVTPPPQLWGHLLNLCCLCVGTAPLGDPMDCLPVPASHATPNSLKQGFFPAPAGGFIMQKVSLCSLSETQLGIKGFLPWGDSKNVVSPLLWGEAGEGFQGSRALVWLPGLLGACVPPCPLLAFTSHISKCDE